MRFFPRLFPTGSRSAALKRVSPRPDAVSSIPSKTGLDGTTDLDPFVEYNEENTLVVQERIDSRKSLRRPKPLWAEADAQGWHKNYVDGKIHLTSIDYNTNVRAVTRLSLPSEPVVNAKVEKLSQLPIDAVDALAGIIRDCNRPPKMLQSEADILSRKLEQRRFPARPEEVREVREGILEQILEENPAFVYEIKSGKNRRFYNEQIQKAAEKELTRRRYNWKPLDFKNKEAAVVYALSRMSGHFSEMNRVLAEFQRIGFVPETVLDYGSGIGSAFWAAYKHWGDQVREYSLMDNDEVVRHFSMDLCRGKNYSGRGEMMAKNVFFRKQLFPSQQHTYDLVILHRTLIELPSERERLELVEKLWNRTNRYLVIVESSLPEAFQALIKVRDFILTAGHEFHRNRTKELLREHSQLDQDTIELFADPKVEEYQKYCVAREKLPPEVPLPTRIPPGHVFAPCPHDHGCPRMSQDRQEPCKFAVRWQEFRADHRTQSEQKDGTLKGTYSYIILAKGERPPGEAYARLLELNKAHDCVACRVCTASDGIQRFTVGKRADKIYGRIRGAMPSQLLPVKFDLLKREVEPFLAKEPPPQPQISSEMDEQIKMIESKDLVNSIG